MHSGFPNTLRGDSYNRHRGRGGGFTLLELVVVIALVGLISASLIVRYVDFTEAAEQANVRDQARQLISNNTLNIARCKSGSPGCINITSTGAQACEDAMANFLPELDLERFEVRNISSATPQDQWRDFLGPGEALFWVNRFLEGGTFPLSPPFQPTQPCILSRVEE